MSSAFCYVGAVARQVAWRHAFHGRALCRAHAVRVCGAPPLRACATRPAGAAGAGGDGGGPPDADAALSAFDSFLEESGLLDETSGCDDPASRRARRRQAAEREAEFKRMEFERRLDVLSALPEDLVVKQVRDKCPGCGSALQSRDETLPGFLPADVIEARVAALKEGAAGKKEGRTAVVEDSEKEVVAQDPNAAFDMAAFTHNTNVEDGFVDGVEGGRKSDGDVLEDCEVVADAEKATGFSAAELEEFRALLKDDGVSLEDAVNPMAGAARPAEEPTPDEIVCQRCFRLNNYGMMEPTLRVESPRKLLERPPVVAEGEADVAAEVAVPLRKKGGAGKHLLTPATFRKNLERLRTKSAVIVYLVDVFDFHGTFLSGLRDLIGDRSPVILAVNKVDLLPVDYKPERVERWVRHESNAMGLPDVEAVHLISSTRGTGVKTLLADAMTLARKRRSDIYVVGAANVGKSSFINNIMSIRQSRKKGARSDGRRKWHKGANKRGKGTLTTSVIPGTTLDVIRIPLDNVVSLYDTPGVIMTHQLTNSLNEKELKAVLPGRSVERVSYRLAEGKALFLGGLARVEVLEGRPFFFTAFVSSDVKVHPGRVENADLFTQEHSGQLLTPPFVPERLHELGEWTTKTFTAEGQGWKRACVDVVLSGLGWVSVTGAGQVKIRVCTPRGVGVFTRDALMPFEVRSAGASRYTGSTGINPREASRSARRRKERRYEREADDYF